MPRILLLDADKANRATFGRRLQRVGYEVVQAGDAREALELAREVAPDLIILEFGWRALDGGEFARRLKAAPEIRPIPIIALTTGVTAIPAGCDDSEPKPVDLPRLLTMLFMLEDPGINAFQSPGMKKRRPINELAQSRQREIIEHTDAGKIR